MSDSKGKILVIRGGAIGDFILTLPVLAALRAQLPQNRIEVLGYAHIAQLALIGGLADAVRSIDSRPLAGFFARAGDLDPALQNYFADFNLIISYLYDPDLIFQENVRRGGRAQFIQGPHRPDDLGALHATEVFLKPLEHLAIFEADATPRLTVNPNGSSRDQIALHPGSGSERKNWPEARWRQFVEMLAGHSRRLLMVGGEAEGQRLNRLAALRPDLVEVAFNLPLPELATRLSGCSAFVGHDSGITHLAAAVGLPGLVLWGETAEQVWRPRSERMRIVRGEQRLAELTAEQVISELDALTAAPRR